MKMFVFLFAVSVLVLGGCSFEQPSQMVTGDISGLETANRKAGIVSSHLHWKVKEKTIDEHGTIFFRLSPPNAVYDGGQRLETFAVKVAKGHRFYDQFAEWNVGDKRSFIHVPYMALGDFAEPIDCLAPHCEEAKKYVANIDGY